MKKRYVATCHFSGVFLHAENDDYIIMQLQRKMAEMMVQVDLELYRKFITTSAKGVLILCVKLNKVPYGLLKSALLFSKKLVGELTEYGFKINFHSLCGQQDNEWVLNDCDLAC